jgi:hypothetical protein
MNILISSHIYIETKNNNHIDDKIRVLKNSLFNAFMMADVIRNDNLGHPVLARLIFH